MRPFLTTNIAIIFAACYLVLSAQQPLPPLTPVRPILPPAHALPPESATARFTRFSFIVYGDTRCQCVATPNPPGAPLPVSPLPGSPEVEPQHAKVIEALTAKVKGLARTNAPVKFVLQTGDAVYRGIDAERWDVFRPLAERITRGLDLPFFFVPGNHDVTVTVADRDPGIHAMGLHNTLSAISRLIPPEGSPRRLSGYGTFAVGYGNLFIIGFDSCPLSAAGTFTSSSISFFAKLHVTMKKQRSTRSTSTIGAIWNPMTCGSERRRNFMAGRKVED